MRGHKRFRAGAWRLVVANGVDPLTGRRRSIYETVRGSDNRAGAKLADARLAELIAAVESGRVPEPHEETRRGPSVAEIAAAWQEANRPRKDRRSGDWVGWSPKTAKTVADNFRCYILPAIGGWDAGLVTGLHLDRLYRRLEEETGLSPSVVVRCHGQIRAMFSWAVRKRMVGANPALAADPPRVKSRQLDVPTMTDVKAVQDRATPEFATFLQLAATVGARRGTLIALRFGDIDLDRATVTFSRSIAESEHGTVEKGTKAERSYTVALGPDTAAILRAHTGRVAAAAEVVGVAFGTESFVFSDDGGASHWSLAWPSHAWQRYSRRAGIAGRLRLHDLRHTAASQMLMAGVPIPVVAERLGCTEGNILRTYRHFIPGSDQHAADLMDRLLRGETGAEAARGGSAPGGSAPGGSAGDEERAGPG
ncbi:MAG: site-specific integrase [Actinomycetota bacterium]|nr:site-specific integrase [Actinomycetota bacterium]